MKKKNLKLRVFTIMFLLRIIFLYGYLHDWNWISGYQALGWTTGYLLYLIYVIAMYGILEIYIYQTVADKKLKIFSIMFLIMIIYVWVSFYSPTYVLSMPLGITSIFYISYVSIMFTMLVLFLVEKIRNRKNVDIN